MITQTGNNLTLRFTAPFDLDKYEIFKRAKRLPESRLSYDEFTDAYTIETHSRYANLLGVETVSSADLNELKMPDFLFEHQRKIIELALKAKTFAVWSDCGTGKTLIELEFARQVNHRTNGGKVLIFTLKDIIPQMLEEARTFYGDDLKVLHIHDRDEMRVWCKNGYSGKSESKFWNRIKDGNKTALEIYERHYSCRQYQDGRVRKLFVGPGEKEVLLGKNNQSLFVWRKFIDDSGQKGINCAVFRNESGELSSELIKEASELAWNRWNGERLYTYVNPEKINNTNPGYCFIKAGWRKCGQTKKGLLIFECFPPQIAVTNYEKMNPDESGQIVYELKNLAGVILDESSRLKSGGGKQKWALIHSCKGIPFKLSCTATPAPNDVIEFASQALFLERMRSENEIIWTFFTKDKITQEWTVKKHAQNAFFEWMCAWSIYLRDPKKYGWSSSVVLPPDPVILKHQIPITREQAEAARVFNTNNSGQMSLFAAQTQGIVGRSKMSQIAKGFVYDKSKETKRIESNKPKFTADLIMEESKDNQVLVWTVFDEESEIIKDHLMDYAYFQPEFAILSGKQKDTERAEILENFRKGKIQILISKAKLLGYGMNFQNVGSMIFSGWDDSFENFYQAVRRAVRYGQKKRVRVHLPYIHELEYAQLENVLRKEVQFVEMIERQEAAYIAAMQRMEIL